MKPTGHTDHEYHSWSPERRKAASERARERIAQAKAAGTYQPPTGKQKTKTAMPATATANASKDSDKKPKKLPRLVDVHVGGRVRAARNIIGWSQEKLADALGVTFQQVQKNEKGTNRIGASRLSQIAQALSQPITFFFDGIDSIEVPAANPCQKLAEASGGVALAVAYLAIANPKARNTLLGFAQLLAGQEEADQSDGLVANG